MFAFKIANLITGLESNESSLHKNTFYNSADCKWFPLKFLYFVTLMSSNHLLKKQADWKVSFSSN